MTLLRLMTVLIAGAFAAPGLAHEFWIEPQNFQVETGDQIVADLKNGQNFNGSTFAWFDSRNLRFDQIQAETMRPVQGRAGDMPAVKIATDTVGLMILVHETTLRKVTYRSWDTFASFAHHKGYRDIAARHAARKLPDAPFDEGYRRLVKSLIGVGHSRGQDRNTGLEIELIALGNPYTDALPDGLDVQLLYQNSPRGDAQIEIFELAPDETVQTKTLITNPEGIARIPLKRGHRYLVDSVVLRPPSAALAQEHDIVWESLWAALTFQRP